MRAKDLADGLEFRFDCFDCIDFEALRETLNTLSIPVIFTLRKTFQEELIEKLILLKPEYLDLEWDRDPAFFKKILSSYPDIKIISSYHNFEETPKDLEAVFRKMHIQGVHTYKIACMAKSTLDALRMLAFVKEHQIIGLCMGEMGQITRILAPVFGSPINYAFYEEALAPGQLSLKELKDIYHYHSLNRETSLYGLIGNPVRESIGHLTHNEEIRKLGLNALYIKMAILPSELEEFFLLIKKIPFCGLSVTMPLKEAVIPFVEEINPIGAVNTLSFQEGKILGLNTDGIGAINALEEKTSISNKKIIIIGAGGAAKAIAYVAKQKGALVTLLNRTPNRIALSLSKMEEIAFTGYDILINCTPEPLPIDPKYILPSAIVMDTKTVPHAKSLLSYATHKIYGIEMFKKQAELQRALWFKKEV